MCLPLRFSVFVWTPDNVPVLAFFSVYEDSCACNCVSQCLYGFLCLRLRFSLFLWTPVLVLVFLSVYLDSCACACVSQCLHELSCLHFSVFLWTLVLAFAFFSVCMDSCVCDAFLRVCMDSCAPSCACVHQCLYELLYSSPVKPRPQFKATGSESGSFAQSYIHTQGSCSAISFIINSTVLSVTKNLVCKGNKTDEHITFRYLFVGSSQSLTCGMKTSPKWLSNVT